MNINPQDADNGGNQDNAIGRELFGTEGVRTDGSQSQDSLGMGKGGVYIGGELFGTHGVHTGDDPDFDVAKAGAVNTISSVGAFSEGHNNDNDNGEIPLPVFRQDEIELAHLRKKYSDWPDGELEEREKAWNEGCFIRNQFYVELVKRRKAQASLPFQDTGYLPDPQAVASYINNFSNEQEPAIARAYLDLEDIQLGGLFPEGFVSGSVEDVPFVFLKEFDRLLTVIADKSPKAFFEENRQGEHMLIGFSRDTYPSALVKSAVFHGRLVDNTSFSYPDSPGNIGVWSISVPAPRRSS